MDNIDKYLNPNDTRSGSVERYWYRLINNLTSYEDKFEFADAWDKLKAINTNEEFQVILSNIANNFFPSMLPFLKRNGYQAIKKSKYTGNDFLYRSLERKEQEKDAAIKKRVVLSKALAAASRRNIAPERFYDSNYMYSDSPSAYARGEDAKTKIYSAIEKSYNLSTDTFDINKFYALIHVSPKK